jgi:hypothetical protein
MREQPTCEHFKHEWEVEEVLGTLKYEGYTQVKLRCKICNAHITGEIIT